MIRISVFVLLFALISIFNNACTSSKTEEECEKPLNPNGDSELSLLMRDMVKHLETEKTLITDGKIQGDYPAKFEKINSAVRSSPDMGGEHFDDFSLMYVSALKAYHQSDSINQRIDNFNNLVSSCIVCHSKECPGPVKTIEKMYIR